MRFLSVLPVIAAIALALPARSQSPFDAPRHSDLSAPVVTIPLVKDGGFYYVDLRVNGRPFRFTIETGAGFFGISYRTAAALGARVDTVEIMTGYRAAVVKIDSLMMGGASFRGLAARVSSSFDNSGIDGIISVSVLRDLLATLDLGRSQLRLERGALPAVNGRDIVEIAGLDRGGRVDVWMDFAGVRTPAVLDTRSFIPIIFPDSLESQLRFEGPPRSMGEARGPSMGTFQLRGARLAGSATIGDATFPRPALALRNRPGTVLGVPLLEEFEITLDQRNKRARFARPSGTPVVIPAMSWESGEGEQLQRRAAVGASPAGPAPMGFNLAGVPGSNQLRIVNLVPGSSAEKQGLRNGDSLVTFDGTPVAAMSQAVFRAAIARGSTIAVSVLRDGQTIAVSIVPQAAP